MAEGWVQEIEQKLSAGGIAVAMTSDGSSVEGEVPLPAEIVHPFTQQPLGRARFVASDGSHVRFTSPPLLSQLPPISIATGVANLLPALATALATHKRAVDGFVQELGDKGIKIQQAESGEPVAEVELYERGIATLAVRSRGVVVSVFKPKEGGAVQIEELVDLSNLDDASDLSLWVDGLVDRKMQAAEPERPSAEAELAHAASSLAGNGDYFDRNGSLQDRDFSQPLGGVSSGISAGTVPGFSPEAALPSPAPTPPGGGPTLSQLSSFFGEDAQLTTFEAQSVVHFDGRLLGVRARLQGGQLSASVHENGQEIHSGVIPGNVANLLEWLAGALGRPLTPAPGISPAPVPAPAPAPAPVPAPAPAAPEPVPETETFFGADDLFGAPGGDLGGGAADWMAPPATDPPTIEPGTYWTLTVQPEDAAAQLVRYVVLDLQGGSYGNTITVPQRDFHVLFNGGSGAWTAKVRVTGKQGDDILYVHVDRSDRMLSNPIALDLSSWRACFKPS
jgi:hypothetical protein